MSRSGYIDGGDMEHWDMIRWRGAVTAAIRGKRGQAFFRDLLDALDAMPEKVLIHGDLRNGDGDCCTLGAVCMKRGVDPEPLDPEDHEQIGKALDVAPALVQEVEYENDDRGPGNETPQHRFERIRRWAVELIQAGGPSARRSIAQTEDECRPG